MWSKLKQQISSIFGKNTENLQTQIPTPAQAEQIIQKTLQALQDAKTQAQNLYAQAQQDEQRLQKNITQLQEETQSLMQKAQKAVAKKDEHEVKILLQQKQIAQNAQAKYRQMHHEVVQRLLQLQQQVQQLSLKQEELLLKKNTLFDSLKQSESQKNIAEYMKTLQGATGLEGFEQEVEKIKIETNLQHESDIFNFEIEFQNENQNILLNDFQKELENEQKKIDEKKNEQEQRKIQQFFNQKNNTNTDKNLNQNPPDKSKILNDFFGKKENETKKENPSEPKITTTENNHKQKKIDDFFK